MNYKERISALQNFKDQLSVETTDYLANETSDVEGWTGNSKTAFDNYIIHCKGLSSKLSGQRATFLTDIDNLIQHIQGLYDSEYNANKGKVTKVYSTDPAKNKIERTNALNRLDIDSSVKDALRLLI